MYTLKLKYCISYQLYLFLKKLKHLFSLHIGRTYKTKVSTKVTVLKNRRLSAWGSWLFILSSKAGKGD